MCLGILDQLCSEGVETDVSLDANPSNQAYNALRRGS